MLALLEGCTLFDRAHTEFRNHAARGDCDAMREYYNRITKSQKAVGRGIRNSGGTPIEAVAQQFEALYAQHR
jgi:hypothetical protein